MNAEAQGGGGPNGGGVDGLATGASVGAGVTVVVLDGVLEPPQPHAKATDAITVTATKDDKRLM